MTFCFNQKKEGMNYGKRKKVEEQTTEKDVQRNLNESIIKIRVDLQNSKLKKSGKNKFAGFDYFELADFLPRLSARIFDIKKLYGIELKEEWITKKNRYVLKSTYWRRNNVLQK